MSLIDESITNIFNNSLKNDPIQSKNHLKRKILEESNVKSISYQEFRKQIKNDMNNTIFMTYDKDVIVSKLLSLYNIKNSKENIFYLTKIVSLTISDSYRRPSNQTFSFFLNVIKKDSPFIIKTDIYQKIKQNNKKIA